MIAQFVILAIGAYLLGSVPSAYLAVKWSRGVDIRQVGTGKIGASNVLSAGSRWLVIPVAAFDIGKGAVSVWAARLIGLSLTEQVVVGMMAVVGHNWPIYLRFKGGGRGVFASLGIITMLSWKLGIIVAILAYSLAPVHLVALGVLMGYTALPLCSWFLAPSFDIKDRLPVTLAFLAISILGVTRRLIAHRTELSKKAPWGEVLLNRLFFDRDIGDRRMWISRGSADKT